MHRNFYKNSNNFLIGKTKSNGSRKKDHSDQRDKGGADEGIPGVQEDGAQRPDLRHGRLRCRADKAQGAGAGRQADAGSDGHGRSIAEGTARGKDILPGLHPGELSELQQGYSMLQMRRRKLQQPPVMPQGRTEGGAE